MIKSLLFGGVIGLLLGAFFVFVLVKDKQRKDKDRNLKL